MVVALLAVFTPADGAVALDGPIAVIVHPNNPTKSLGARELYDLFTSERTSWPDGGRVMALSMPPHNDVRVAFDFAVMQRDEEGVARFWIDRRVRGGAPPPRVVPTAQLIARVVETAPGAIGYVPLSLAASHKVRIIARVLGGKVLPP